MNKYRSHHCNELRKNNVGQDVILSGWINKKRDHGNLLFIDLRDNYGITQCIIDQENENFKFLEKTPLETVVKIKGKVIDRTAETINKDIATGEIEVAINNSEILGTSIIIPYFHVISESKDLTFTPTFFDSNINLFIFY